MDTLSLLKDQLDRIEQRMITVGDQQIIHGNQLAVLQVQYAQTTDQLRTLTDTVSSLASVDESTKASVIVVEKDVDRLKLQQKGLAAVIAVLAYFSGYEPIMHFIKAIIL